MWPSPPTPTAERESSYAAPIPTGCDRRGSDPVGNSALLTSICLIRGNLPAGTFRAMTDGWQVAEAIRVVVGALGTAATAGISLYLIGLERKDRRRDACERKEAQGRRNSLDFQPLGGSGSAKDSRFTYGLRRVRPSGRCQVHPHWLTWRAPAHGPPAAQRSAGRPLPPCTMRWV
jgi:hypothetical protein